MAQSRLAIEGGSPVRRELLPYGRHQIDDEDIAEVVAALRSGWVTTGPRVEAFERALASHVATGRAVSFGSGTAALQAAIFAAGLGPGDELITTPLTFCATANCALYQGATPVFADVERDTLNLDPERVAERISPRTRAVIAMHYAGHPAEMEELRDLSSGHGLALIEDACHALGAEYRGRPAGGLGDLAAFSFHPVKHITTGEGGAVTTDDGRLADRMKSFRNHGIDVDARTREARGEFYYEVRDLGINGRLSDIACALGISQLRKLEANLARRRQIAARYATAFSGASTLATPIQRDDVRHAWHLYPIRLKLEALRADRARVFRALRAEGLGVNVHYVPLHLQPLYRKRLGSEIGAYPVTETAYERLISLPIFPGMTECDVDDVIEAVDKVLGYYAR